MSTVNIRVTGLRELGEKMKKLDLSVRFKIADRAMRAGGLVIKKHAQQKAPIGTRTGRVSGVNITPGNLRRSISVRRVKTKSTQMTSEFEVGVIAPRRLNAKQKATGKVGAYYWRYVEFGTSKMAPRPFMRRGAISGRGEAVDKIKSTLAREIEKAIDK